MGVQEKFGIFVRYIRDSKRKVFSAALVASIISVILFIAGSYWLLYYYYDSIVNDYYSSILRDISAFQHELIGRESYPEDLKSIARAVDQHKGVEHVWFTNRFGTLIYSTDSDLLEQYRKKRLPSDYYESIQWVWSFENGYPKAHVVPIHRIFSLRFSIPLYAFGREDYDFVMGMDVRRFVYLPENLSLLLPFSIGYIVFFIALLFFPFFIWVNSRFSGLTTQAKVLFGTMEFDRGRPAVPEDLRAPLESQLKEETKSPEQPETPMKPREEVKVKPPEETEAPKPEVEVKEKSLKDIKAPLETKVPKETKYPKDIKTPKETQTSEEGKVPERPKEKVKEQPPLEMKEAVQAESPKEIKDSQEAKAPKVSLESKGEVRAESPPEADSLASFIEKKKGIFMKEDIELPFIHASSFVHHSQELGGSYIYTHRGRNALYFTSFVLPYKKASDALEHTEAMISFLQQSMDSATNLREFSEGVNSFCLENSMELDLAVISINEGNRAVQYNSYGSGCSLYVKHDKDQVKELAFQMPRLGTVSKDKSDTISSFDIKFVQNDIFLLLPQNAAEIDFEGMNLMDTVKKEILPLKGRSAREIAAQLSKHFEAKVTIPQTGFVVFKFI